jgi:hypothetical protein
MQEAIQDVDLSLLAPVSSYCQDAQRPVELDISNWALCDHCEAKRKYGGLACVRKNHSRNGEGGLLFIVILVASAE